MSVQPTSIAPGDTATVTIQDRREPCYGSEPSHHETLLARLAGSNGEYTAVAEGDTDPQGVASFTVAPSTSTEYTFNNAPRFNGDYARKATLVVNRYSGSCAGVLTLTGPGTVSTGSAARLEGTAPDTSTVNILFRKRGQTSFQVRRSITARADRTFSVAYVADDDYRLYASGARCDSPPVLVQAAPLISGPAAAAKGTRVMLLVRAPAGLPVKVYLHRAGTVGYQLARTGTVDSSGRYTTAYRATADYRYYAVVGNDRRQSSTGLTQVR
ncbi:MAG: hypothetical protein LC789_10825 [Actinobacteria bacterium]|nr:hypothetical protein [Actinomycetota bacterium]MCA1720918.1 hypothetical protein [Actinomycetota bacterium]